MTTTEETIRIGKVARLNLLIESSGVDGALVMFNEAMNNIIENAQQDNDMNFSADEYARICAARDSIIDVIHDYNNPAHGSDVSLIVGGEDPVTQVNKFDGGILAYISDVFFYKRNGFSFALAHELADITKKHRAERNSEEGLE